MPKSHKLIFRWDCNFFPVSLVVSKSNLWPSIFQDSRHENHLEIFVTWDLPRRNKYKIYLCTCWNGQHPQNIMAVSRLSWIFFNKLKCFFFAIVPITGYMVIPSLHNVDLVTHTVSYMVRFKQNICSTKWYLIFRWQLVPYSNLIPTQSSEQ